MQTKINNAVTQATIETLDMTTRQNLNILPVQIHTQKDIEQGVAVKINITGDIRGNIQFRFTEKSAKQMASALMMGMLVDTLDEMSISALSELGNMISGCTATHLSESGIFTDITTPTVTTGDIHFDKQTITIPLESDDEIQLTIDISLDTQ